MIQRKSRAQIYVPKSHLAVARGVGVPVGQRLEGTAQPWPLGDKGGQSDVGHLDFVVVEAGDGFFFRGGVGGG